MYEGTFVVNDEFAPPAPGSALPASSADIKVHYIQLRHGKTSALPIRSYMCIALGDLFSHTIQVWDLWGSL